MSKYQETIEVVKHLAYKELDYCNSIDTPYLCNAIKTPAGLESAVDQIVELVGKQGISITMAIAKIESGMNPNQNAN